jgi:hypothetical protein
MDFLYFLVGGMILVFLASLTFGYFLAKSAIGEKAANQNTLLAIVGILVGIAMVLPFIILPNGINKFGYFQAFLFFAGFGFLVARVVRGNKFMGEVVKILGRNQQNKILFWVGVLQLVVQPIAFLLILPALLDGGVDFLEFFTKAGGVLNAILFGVYAVYFGNSPTQLQENGLSMMGMSIRWEKISEYKFENIKQNTFRAKYKYDIPFIPGIINLAVSDADKIILQEILQQKLPHLGEIRAA